MENKVLDLTTLEVWELWKLKYEQLLIQSQAQQTFGLAQKNLELLEEEINRRNHLVEPNKLMEENGK